METSEHLNAPNSEKGQPEQILEKLNVRDPLDRTGTS